MEKKSDSPGSVIKKLMAEPSLYYNPVKEKDYAPKKPSAGNPANTKSKAAGFNIEKYVKDNFSKPLEEKTADQKVNKKNNASMKTDSSLDLTLSQKRLQEAVIWSEILGKPVSKRHRRWNRNA